MDFIESPLLLNRFCLARHQQVFPLLKHDNLLLLLLMTQYYFPLTRWLTSLTRLLISYNSFHFIRGWLCFLWKKYKRRRSRWHWKKGWDRKGKLRREKNLLLYFLFCLPSFSPWTDESTAGIVQHPQKKEKGEEKREEKGVRKERVKWSGRKYSRSMKTATEYLFHLSWTSRQSWL